MAGSEPSDVPPAAAARLGRLTGAATRSSLVTVASAVGLESVGLFPVSEVMGAVGMRISWLGGAGAWAPSERYVPRTVVAGQGPSPGAGYRPYVDSMNRGYRTALSRLSAEAAAVGADGVIGVRLSARVRDHAFFEFVGVGTAVRGRTTQRPGRVFLTDLPGQDVAKLMAHGWVPVTVAVGFSVAIRLFEDPRSQAMVSPGQNYEVTGYSDMLARARADARRRFEGQIRAIGADGALCSDVTARLRTLEERPATEVAEARMIGTAIASFAATPPVRSALPGVLPLRD